jgi:hypothetical protein
MTPILGIWASGASAAAINSFESIATVTVGSGGASTVTFSGIPSTYQHLQIRGIARGTVAGSDENIYMQFNGVAGTSYSWHRMLANGSSVSSGNNPSQPSGVITVVSASSSTANVFGATVIDILDYANTNKNKTVRGFGGNDQSSSGYACFQSFAFLNTAAITSIDITSSANWAQYSQFALYGIKG